MQGIVVGASFLFTRYCEAVVGGHKNEFEYWYKWETFTDGSTHRYARHPMPLCWLAVRRYLWRLVCIYLALGVITLVNKCVTCRDASNEQLDRMLVTCNPFVLACDSEMTQLARPIGVATGHLRLRVFVHHGQLRMETRARCKILNKEIQFSLQMNRHKAIPCEFGSMSDSDRHTQALELCSWV